MVEQPHARSADVIAIVIYLCSMALIGLYFAKKNKNTEEYFLGGRNFPGWAIGLSMVGTSISSVTFLAFPAAAFILDWRQVVPNLMLPLATVLAIMVFIPFFRKNKTASAFEYLETRYGPLVRLYGSIGFIITQLVRLATVLYLITIPISLLTGVNIIWIIILGGAFISFYTVAGGIEAVIWTDVVQTIILWFGGIFCLFFIFFKLPDGVSQMFSMAAADNKFSLGSMEWDWGSRTFYTMAITGIFGWLGMYATNQNVVQRYIAAKSEHEAKKATIISAVTCIPTWVFFFAIGTGIYVFFKVFPDPNIASMQADQVFPYFILSKLPKFFAGVIVAAVLAAGMSSLDSSINSIATIIDVDILRRFTSKNKSEKFYFLVARISSIIVSIVMILGAMVFHFLPKESMMDLGMIISGVFGSGLIGLFMIGFFSTRVGYKASLIALAITIIFNIYLALNAVGWLPKSLKLDIHAYWVLMLVNIVYAVIAYILSFVIKNRKNLDGITVWTLPKKSKT